MTPNPFHTYARTRELAERMRGLLAAYASANIEVLPYQIAAAEFALRAHGGAILADEGSLGKTYEALLIASQFWLEGKTRQLLILPGNLVEQWMKKIDENFTLPRTTWLTVGDIPEDSLIITTYDHAVRHAEAIAARQWDIAIFDEADALFKPENETTTALRAAVGGAFKLLLTPTPMKKDIMDIYGLLHFIDQTILPEAGAFYKRYFRHPERYPELTQWVSQYAFRTLKSQVAGYVDFTERVPFTPRVELTPAERELYALVEKFIALPGKASYPKMDPWELSLMLYHSLSSSPQAFCKTIEGAIQRAKGAESALLQEIRKCAESIRQTAKMQALAAILKKAAPDKAIVFTDNLTTLGVLENFLAGHVITTGHPGYAKAFREAKKAVLIATDAAAKGLDFEFCPMVVNYDLLWNAVEMEQRIARCHRQGQTKDVLVVNLLQPENLADVRILELINKRVAQFGGIFGMSDPLVGNFNKPLDEILPQLRSAAKIKQAFAENRQAHKAENRERVAHAEQILFTTFTQEIADKITLSPCDIEELNSRLWEAASDYLERRGDYEIDRQTRTATLKTEEQPHLFYYRAGARNKPYTGLKKYRRITPTSPLIRGILENVECADSGTVTVAAPVEPCEIEFYIGFSGKNTTFVGRTASGRVMSEAECREILALPVVECTEQGPRKPCWLRETTVYDPHEEPERIKLEAKRQKAALEHGLDDLRGKIRAARQELAAQSDRMKEMIAGKRLKMLEKELRGREQGLFMERMRIDAAADEKIARCGVRPRTTRHFVVKIYGQN